MKRKKISTSEDLLENHPQLAQEKGWDKFAREFDKQKCREYRMEAMAAYKTRESEQVQCLKKLCQNVLNDGLSAEFKRTEGGGREQISQEEQTRTRIDAAVQLARKVLECFESTTTGNSLRSAMRSAAEKGGNPWVRQDKASPAAIVLNSFLKFLNRERKLPTKKEVNIESNRLRSCVEIVEFGNEERHFGERLVHNGETWIVYDCFVSDIDWDVGGETKVVWRSRAVPSEQWDVTQWKQSSRLTEYSTPLGLKGLPEANEDKGKKARLKRFGKTRSA